MGKVEAEAEDQEDAGLGWVGVHCSHLVGFRIGSVGVYAMTHGSFEMGTEGYHVMTMRTMKSSSATDRKGPSAPAICFAVPGFSASPAAVSNNACAVAMA